MESFAFVFDVDGTLTPSRKPIDQKFLQEFLQFEKRNPVYLVSGSDYPKTLEQLGRPCIMKAQALFSCCGNEYRRGREIMYQSQWKPPADLIDNLLSILQEDRFPLRTGQHIEYRTGMINFSIVGRAATWEQRREFWEYDQETQTRKNIALWLKSEYPECDFSVAGETGIDIYQRGCDKSQIMKWIFESNIIFFGDRTEPGGNDYEIAQCANRVHTVADWQETQSILRSQYAN